MRTRLAGGQTRKRRKKPYEAVLLNFRYREGGVGELIENSRTLWRGSFGLARGRFNGRFFTIMLIGSCCCCCAAGQLNFVITLIHSALRNGVNWERMVKM